MSSPGFTVKRHPGHSCLLVIPHPGVQRRAVKTRGGGYEAAVQRIKAQASPSLPRHSTHRMIIAACLRRRRATNTQPTMAEPMDDQPCMTIRKHSRGRHVRWFSPTRTPGREATPRDSFVCREAPPRDPLAGSEARARPHPPPCAVYLTAYMGGLAS